MRATSHRFGAPRQRYKWTACKSARETIPSSAVSAPETSSVQEEILDCAIVGGGPAGLALAIAMKAKGLSVKVFEATPEVKEMGSAVFLQSFGLSTLDEIAPGLAAEVEAAGRVIDTIHLTNPAGETKIKLRMDELAELLGYPFVGITRYNLQRVLLQRLSDDDVVLGHRLKALHTSDPVDPKTLEFEGITQPVRARVVIGADGRRSAVRKRVLSENERNNEGFLTAWALASLPVSPAPAGELRMAYAKGQAVYYGEVQDGLTMWSSTAWETGPIERDPERRAERVLSVLSEDWPEDVRDMVRATPSSRLIEVKMMDNPLQWWSWSREPGVTLVGDAAHAMFPSIGMGLTSALQDVVALAKYINGPETASAQALDRYERERRIPATMLQLVSRMTMVVIKNIVCA